MRRVSVGVGIASLIEGRITALVHARVVDPVERTKHALFIGLHFAPSLAALTAIPVRLAYGIPRLWEIGAILLLQAPLVAALLASRNGALRIAQAINAVGLIALGCLLALASPTSGTFAFSVLAVACVETAGAVGLRAAIAAAAVAAGLVAMFPASVAGMPPVGGAGSSLLVASGLFVVLAYAAVLAAGAIWVERVARQRNARVEAHGRAMAHAVGDAVLEIDRRGAVLSCSDDVDALFALTSRDFAGRGFYERVHLADRPAFLQALSDGFEGLPNAVAVLRLRTATVRSTRGDFQEPVHAIVEMRSCRIDGDGLTQAGGERAVCLVRDITARHARDLEAAAARQAMERADETQERFLANVSHELRTPLNAIIGFADLLRMETVKADEAKRSEYAAIISASGHHLLSVVNSILDMSKLEAGSFTLEATTFEPATLLDGCLDIVKLKAAETGIDLVRNYDARLAPIVGDERAFRQIVINLLSNAVKFTPRGGTVTLSARSELGLTLVVEDTGIGIAASDMPRLGDAFFQASNARSRTYEGTGLGLSLVRGLVGLHGGSIDVASAQGAGTAVTVRLPRDCRANATARSPVVIRTGSRPPFAPFPVCLDKVKASA